MTMVPSQNLFNQHQQQFYDGYGGCGDSYTESLGFMSRFVGYEYYCSDNTSLGSDLVVGHPLMAEDESRTSSVNEAVSSSKDVQEERDERWLQLGLGNSQQLHHHDQAAAVVEPMSRKSGERMLQLDLLPGGSSQQQPLVPTFHLNEFRAPRPPATNYITSILSTNLSTPMFLQHPRTSSLSFPQHEVTWGYRPHPWNPTSANLSSSSSSSIPLGVRYYPQPFQHQSAGGAAGPSSSTMRIIDPPRRPHSNIWFLLQASQNQNKEPFLPQIPKSYLRIKDGRMTVRVLMKYLASKLRLDSESEVSHYSHYYYS
ncbi:hypothetical protein AQUCO_05200042v1 [Aquilegia coerulea]|uniref:Uncharacterized protein n=1 Tax=Aquilegia coerulea TaxID=218851 RepID=A0A2G5CIQ0_AQUCA|nr:hypothetical protein AQUCO_05200042v1 [Aquilegia coerulea]